MTDNFYPHPFDELAVDLCNSARRHIRILSPNLDRKVFDRSELCDAMSKLARTSRYCDIKILVHNSRPLVEQGHRLLTLARRIPSSMRIQVLAEHPELTGDTLLIRDSDGLLFKPAGSEHQGFYEADSKAVVKPYLDKFDELWRASASNLDLRQMRI